MTQQLANDLISYYEKAIKDLKSRWFGIFSYRIKDWHTYLFQKQIFAGICNVIQHVFNEPINPDRWIQHYQKNGPLNILYWGPIPNYASNREEAIKALQLRVDILKTFDESWYDKN